MASYPVPITENLLQEIIDGPDLEKVAPILDKIIRVRAVQDFRPSETIGFILRLKGLIREQFVEEIRGDSQIDFSKRTWAGFLDAGKVHFPLVLRNPRPGDRIVPLGMAGHRKLKNFFIDLKVPSEERSITPILVQEDTLVAVCGHRIDERFKVTPRTERILKITMG